jgi:hypothetical protein
MLITDIWVCHFVPRKGFENCYSTTPPPPIHGRLCASDYLCWKLGPPYRLLRAVGTRDGTCNALICNSETLVHRKSYVHFTGSSSYPWIWCAVPISKIHARVVSWFPLQPEFAFQIRSIFWWSSGVFCPSVTVFTRISKEPFQSDYANSCFRSAITL